eukprot:CAMPEP_0194319218 /NCGR_PEP_ID=MMETSP0171-20130528/15694_1 /TAXON_ID=218684 /ORGANISM="Corethron pennatum, Strain L29A3" /LENGTH=73 /DNA_ID=CAMNT_0039076353 /DNA_START=76 /DNA_END=293 /DNA_ORIENTATION=-
MEDLTASSARDATSFNSGKKVDRSALSAVVAEKTAAGSAVSAPRAFSRRYSRMVSSRCFAGISASAARPYCVR